MKIVVQIEVDPDVIPSLHIARLVREMEDLTDDLRSEGVIASMMVETVEGEFGASDEQ